VLLHMGCVQPAMLPNINYATARVLDAVGIQSVVVQPSACCGAVKFHLNDQAGGLAQMRASIDAWWPAVQAGEVEAIVSNASGCGALLKDWGHLLRHDGEYAEKARRISALTRDLSELLPDLLPELAAKLQGKVQVPPMPMAYHPPCTLQHAQKLKGTVERHLGTLGFTLTTARTETHLCCGSAGTYSVLQPEIAQTLRDRKLGALQEAVAQPAAILSANIGCMTHLQSGTDIPVRHWIEVLDEALQ
jgi:glycolate oxidase iron-sulfur subunit